MMIRVAEAPALARGVRVQMAGQVTVLSPGTRERRFAAVDMAYVVDEVILCAEWFAEYLDSWTDREVSMESLVNGVVHDLGTAVLGPVSASVSCEVAGISVTTFAGA